MRLCRWVIAALNMRCGLRDRAKPGSRHVLRGLQGPDDLKGQRTTEQGAGMKVTGKGGDIKVNDAAKVVCGGHQVSGAGIYMSAAVLDPAQGPERTAPTGTR